MKQITKTTTPAAKSFLETIAELAKPVSKLSSAQANADPKLAARTRFVNAVEEQKKLIAGDTAKNRWFAKQADGSVELTLRNGNTAMKLGDSTFYKCENAKAAAAFLDAVVVGTKAGELDTQLAATARPPRAKKAATAPTAPPTPAAA